MDETSQKIIDAAMTLIRDQGYVATTTKDIARAAGVNECTLFRKFGNKKDIVLQGITQEKWRANVTPEIFKNVRWELRPDLEMFLTDRIYGKNNAGFCEAFHRTARASALWGNRAADHADTSCLCVFAYGVSERNGTKGKNSSGRF